MAEFRSRLLRKRKELTRMYMRRGFPPSILIHVPGELKITEETATKWKFYLGPESGAKYCLPPAITVGDEVWYIPDHADDRTHRDAVKGEVVATSVDPGRLKWPPDEDNWLTDYARYRPKYMVDYDDGSNVAKATYRRHLERA